jgi:hypothetical protein
MAKRKKTPTPRKPTRKEHSRAKREARLSRWIVAAAIATGVLIVGVLVYGYVAEVVIKGRQPVATVNGVAVTMADWQARVREQRIRMRLEMNTYTEQRMTIDPNDPSAEMFFQQLDQLIRELDTQLSPEYAVVLGGQVLDQMVREELYRQEADRRGISVSAGEVDLTIEQFFGFDRDALLTSTLPSSELLTETQVVSPTTMTEEDYQRRYQDYVDMVLKPSGLGVDGFRTMIEGFLLAQRVQEAVSAEMEPVADQVQMRYLSFGEEEEAAAVVERLAQGEEFDAIQEEYEADETSSVYAIELEWRTATYLNTQFGEELGEAVFGAELGVYPEPLLGATGRYYVVDVLGHEMREMDDFMVTYAQSAFFEEWSAAQMENVEYSEDWMEKVPFD